MHAFEFSIPTQIVFGPGTEARTGELAAGLGDVYKRQELGGGEKFRARGSRQQTVVGSSLPADRHGADGAAQPVQGPEILHAQIVVWRGQKR